MVFHGILEACSIVLLLDLFWLYFWPMLADSGDTLCTFGLPWASQDSPWAPRLLQGGHGQLLMGS